MAFKAVKEAVEGPDEGFLPEARALLTIATALQGLTRERACAIMAIVCAELGEYEHGEEFMRGAKRWRNQR